MAVLVSMEPAPVHSVLQGALVAVLQQQPGLIQLLLLVCLIRTFQTVRLQCTAPRWRTALTLQEEKEREGTGGGEGTRRGGAQAGGGGGLGKGEGEETGKGREERVKCLSRASQGGLWSGLELLKSGATWGSMSHGAAVKPSVVYCKCWCW